MKKYSVTFTITLADYATHPDEWLKNGLQEAMNRALSEPGESMDDFKVQRMIVVDDEIQEFMDIMTAP